MKQIRKEKNSGFSFIELLVASTIIFTLIIGTAQLTLQSILIKKRSDNRLNSAMIFTSQLEQLKSQFFTGSVWQDNLHSAEITGQAGNQPFIVEWIFQSTPAGMKAIVMSCYPETSPHRKTRLMLYLSEELGF